MQSRIDAENGRECTDEPCHGSARSNGHDADDHEEPECCRATRAAILAQLRAATRLLPVSGLECRPLRRPAVRHASHTENPLHPDSPAASSPNFRNLALSEAIVKA